MKTKSMYIVTQRGLISYPIKTGFKTEASARKWAKREFGDLRGIIIKRGLEVI